MADGSSRSESFEGFSCAAIMTESSEISFEGFETEKWRSSSSMSHIEEDDKRRKPLKFDKETKKISERLNIFRKTKRLLHSTALDGCQHNLREFLNDVDRNYLSVIQQTVSASDELNRMLEELHRSLEEELKDIINTLDQHLKTREDLRSTEGSGTEIPNSEF